MKWLKILALTFTAMVVLFTTVWLLIPVMGQQSLGAELSDKLEIPHPTVIAHRGASHLAPESTAPAYKLARDLGADYLEADLQRTKDGVIVVFHDETLERTTNIEEVYPNRLHQTIDQFTYEELLKLDIGSWFNDKHPERYRESYLGLKILTLDGLIDIAEAGNNNPGLYLETKFIDKYPGMEQDIVDILESRGWIGKEPKLSGIDKSSNKEIGAPTVNVAEGSSRVIFQSFYPESVVELKKIAPDVLAVLLISESIEEERGWNKIIEEAVNISDGIGPVGTLAWPWRLGPAHKHQLIIHPYTINPAWQMKLLRHFGADGVFTDRPEIAIEVYEKGGPIKIEALFERLGY
ncbi:glycerophosphodiester phosphodiesterase family protein [Proteinivorax hydrogeniformans]|uniref:Glycerophosphodiester phosphodiesterase family protein n=1 Tax=Proteinivorax hydrogeniformans TaxID=1826727 RepID=A0AAU8HRK4_9FIRM